MNVERDSAIIPKLLKRDGSGGDRYVTAPFQSSVSTLALPAAMSCENGLSRRGTDASMFELPESRQYSVRNISFAGAGDERVQLGTAY